MSNAPGGAGAAVRRHPASFRDPAGVVMQAGSRVLRALRGQGVERLGGFLGSELARSLVAAGCLVGTRDVSGELDRLGAAGFEALLEHEPVAFVSYPYEWTFELLQAAALLHLDIQLEALAHGFALADASAYNIQFRGPCPVFVDVLSFRRYVDGELWAAQRQFCEQFLNPLLLDAARGVPHNAWFRGALEGIDMDSIAALLPARYWLSPRALIHVLLPALNQRRVARQGERRAVERIRAARLPRGRFRALLVQLRDWIAALRPRRARSAWADYERTRTYDPAELAAKRRFVAEFAAATRPARLWDFGCNDGEFLEVALAHGAASAVGFDADHGALALAYRRARDRKLDLLPLYLDAANPSPGQGWQGQERDPIEARGKPDAITALALQHHLALGRNIPLPEVVRHLTGFAPRGVIEFVHKSDPTAQRMIALKGDLFPDYHEDAFRAVLQAEARIVRREVICAAGRTLYWFER